MLSYPAAYVHHIHLVRLSPLTDARKYTTSRINQNKIVPLCHPFVKIAEDPFFFDTQPKIGWKNDLADFLADTPNAS